MTGILAAIGFLLVIYGLKSGGSGLGALFASLGVAIPSLTPGDTILPNGQPAQMTPAQWGQWVDAEILKVAGPKPYNPHPARYLDVASETDWFRACIAERQLHRRKDALGNWVPDSCGGPAAGGPGTLLTATARTGQVTGLAVQGAQAATSAGLQIGGSLLKSVPVIGSIIGGITAIVGIFTASHAKAEQTERAYMCSLVPQANAALADIDQRFRSGQISTPQAHDELENLFANFVAAAKPVLGGGADYEPGQASKSSCNMACAEAAALRMICDVREQLDY